MAVKTNEIESYYLYHFSEPSGGLAALIACYHRTDHMGSLKFYEDGVTIPAGLLGSDGRIFLSFKEHHLRDMVETLRLEKPLYINIETHTSRGYLSTSKEPIGEEESR